MSDRTTLPLLQGTPLDQGPQRLEQLYRVPLETRIERELSTVMAYLLSHVLTVSHLKQPEEPT